jgi:hypothetical protein
MDGKRAVWTGALAMLVALSLPATSPAWWHGAADDGSGAPNYDPPLYYPRTTYWFPQLHRCLTRHRPVTVSVYPPDCHGEIECSYLFITCPTSLIQRPYNLPAEAGLEPLAPPQRLPEMRP